MSPWSKGVYHAPSQRVPQERFSGKTPDGSRFEERTRISDATAFAKTTPTGQPLRVCLRDGVKEPPALPIPIRLDIVACILHGTMAFGKMAARFLLQRTARAPLAGKIAVAAELRRAHLRLNVYATAKKKKISLKGNETRKFFDVWPVLAQHLSLEGTPEDAAMQHMGNLLNVLYRSSYSENPASWVYL